MSETPIFDRWGRGCELHRRYVENARELLDGGGESRRAREERHAHEAFRRAREEWLALLSAGHGDALAELPSEDPETELFVDSLYYEFVVSRVIAVAAETFGVTVANREPRVNSDALSFGFRSLHERAIDVAAATERFDEHLSADALREADADSLRSLYESIVPREVRLELGEYYTPRGVAELAADAMERRPDEGTDSGDGAEFGGRTDSGDGAEFGDGAGPAERTYLDPGCGSGVFLSVCIDRILDAIGRESDRGGRDRDADAVVDLVTSSVFGIDLNPVAVTSAKLTYLLALLPVLERSTVDAVEIPVFLTDAVGVTRNDALTFRGDPFEPTVTRLVGNPPWITWGRLSDERKRRWRETYVDRLGLSAHEGLAARLGHANDDVSVPFVWACIHRYLRAGGRASFVLKRGLSKGPAGTLFRKLAVGDRPLDVTHVHDFNDLEPFGDAVNANAAVYTLTADAPATFPIETTSWTARSAGDGAGRTRSPDFSSADAIRRSLTAESTALVPLDPDETTSTWVRRDAERAALGDCEHEIRHGVKDDAQDVFSIDRDRLAELEPDLVYPYIKSRHVVKYGLFGHELRLVPLRTAHEDNEAELRAEQPRTYEYLSDRRHALERRSSSWLRKGTFYNVFGLGEYTWAAYKVAWCRLGFKPQFVVLSTVEDPDLGTKQVVPGDHFMFVATDDRREAHFLCALLNSAPYRRSLESIASDGKASLSKSVVSKLRLPEWRETADARRLATLSMRAHEVVPEHTDTSKRAYNATTIDELAAIQAEIDRIVERLLADDAFIA